MKTYTLLAILSLMLPVVYAGPAGGCSGPYVYNSASPSLINGFLNPGSTTSLTLYPGQSAGWCSPPYGGTLGQQTSNRLKLTIDGVVVADTATIPGPTYGFTTFFSGGTSMSGTYVWNFAPFVEKAFVVQTEGRDSSGSWDVISYTYHTDFTPPSISWPAIPNPAVGVLTITPTVGDNWAAQGSLYWVAFFVDGTMVLNDTAPPFSLLLDTTIYPNGIHSLAATISDKANNSFSPLPATLNIINPNCGDGYCDSALGETTVSCPGDCVVVPDCGALVWNPSLGRCDAGVCDASHIDQPCSGANSLSDPTGDNYYCSDGQIDNGVPGDGYCCATGDLWDPILGCRSTNPCDQPVYCPEASASPFDTYNYVSNPSCVSSSNPSFGNSPAACCSIPGGKFGTTPWYDYTDAGGNAPQPNLVVY